MRPCPAVFLKCLQSILLHVFSQLPFDSPDKTSGIGVADVDVLYCGIGEQPHDGSLEFVENSRTPVLALEQKKVSP